MRLLAASILACALTTACSVATAEQLARPADDGPALTGDLDRMFPHRGALSCATVAMAEEGVPPIPHADCGMGRHCPDEHRCCLTSSDFWCCPEESKCDYEHPQACKAE